MEILGEVLGPYNLVSDAFLCAFVRAEVARLGKFMQTNQKIIEGYFVLLLALAKVAPFYGLIDLTFNIMLHSSDNGGHATSLPLNLMVEDLAHRFDIVKSTVCSIFDKWINVMFL